MRKKILILFSLMLIFPIVFGSCIKKNKSPEEVVNFLKDLNTYTSDFKMEIKNDKQVITYEGKHYYDKNLGHVMKLGEDKIFVYKEDKIYANDIKNNVKYTVDKEFDEGFIYTFIEKYIELLYTNEEIKYDFKEIDGKKYQIIKLIIPTSNKEIDNAQMYVNLENYIPEYIFIYDEKNNEKIKVTYKNFEVNPKLNKNLFQTENK
ncbi:germination lipoprotein GerS-related protein [Clostridium prolinivorans]|uniref:germination lipoprotein GerS-related protein n=1 Tax=Clostridium prolinivorans TaxID=2769420 RepID=UPI000FDBCF6D|nr:germination lipoprotein GerS-related protein [Clostridium prolinivorans]